MDNLSPQTSPPRFRAGILTLSILFLLCLFPFRSFSESYVASKNSDVFHKSSCFYVDRILDKNKIYFATVEEAERSGRRGCSRCKPSSGKSSSSTQSSVSTSSHGTYASGYSAGYSAGQSDMESKMTLEMERSVRKAKSDSYQISAIVGIPSAFFFFLYISRKRETAAKQQFQRQLNELQQHLQNSETQLHSATQQLKICRTLNGVRSGTPNITSFPSIPDDVVIDAVFFPIKGKRTKDKPFGDYTVFLSKSGKKYHARCGCCGAYTPSHVFDVVPELSPCSNCVPYFSRITEVPDWYLQIKQRDS